MLLFFAVIYIKKKIVSLLSLISYFTDFNLHLLFGFCQGNEEKSESFCHGPIS